MNILLIAYDNESYISSYPLGLGYIAAACKQAGHRVSIYNQDIYHYDEQHLTEHLKRNQYDVVGLGVCGGYYQYGKVLKICDAIQKAKKQKFSEEMEKPIVILGGHLVSPDPDFFLKKTNADFIVVGEGEETIVELLNRLESGQSVSNVKGIAYIENGRFIQTEPRKPVEEIDKIAFPAWELFPMEHYVLMRFPNAKRNERCFTVLSGRGCPFKCNFCYRMTEGFRARSAESIIEEVSILKRNYNVSYICFYDELLMNSENRAIEISESIIKAKLNISWFCSGRLNYAKPNVLKIMKEAGCVFINYGIESLDEQALKVMNKALTVEQITRGIENTLAAGISPGFNIIFGNIGETKDSLKKGVEFLLKYDDHSQLRTIRPVTPYPGSPLYYYAIEKGLLKNCQDFYENKHKNSDLLAVNFTELSDDEFHSALYEANLTLLNNYYSFQKKQNEEILKDLYFNKNTGFRGFRSV